MNGRSARPAWRPLPKGLFTGIEWSTPGALDGQDPYLAWAEVDGFAGYRLRGEQAVPRWLPIVIELSPQSDVAALMGASSISWLQVPAVYAQVPGLRFCSARVRPAFFTYLRTRPGLRQLVQRIELGLPVGGHVHPLRQPGHAKAALAPPCEPAQRLTGQVLGLIDSGLSLANTAFLDAHGRTRVRHFWRQDCEYQGPWPSQDHHGMGRQPLDPARAGPVPCDLGYGHALSGDDIDRAMARFTQGGRLDEEQLYQHLQLWNLARPVSHGSHVASLAASPGNVLDPAHDNASRAALVAVQLDWANVRDTSGGAMNVGVLDGLMFILGRCAPGAQVVVNISWGTLAGPHDGSSVLEAAMDQLVDLHHGRLQITVPAGNAYQSRTHANLTLQPGQQQTLHWRVLPDDHTQSFLELWLPVNASGVTIAVTPPGHAAPLPALCSGEAGVWAGPDASGQHQPLCALLYPTRSALGRQGTCALLALAPTSSRHPDTATAPFGAWTITLHNQGADAVTLDAYIERDDVALGQRTGARQSYFEDPAYDTSGNLGSFVDNPAHPTSIRRSGTFNSLATGHRTASVGGVRAQADAASHFARYSPIQPDPDASRPTRPGVKKIPDTFKPSDDNTALWGMRGAGTLSGSVARLAGTSSSAPQLARELLNQG